MLIMQLPDVSTTIISAALHLCSPLVNIINWTISLFTQLLTLIPTPRYVDQRQTRDIPCGFGGNDGLSTNLIKAIIIHSTVLSSSSLYPFFVSLSSSRPHQQPYQHQWYWSILVKKEKKPRWLIGKYRDASPTEKETKMVLLSLE